MSKQSPSLCCSKGLEDSCECAIRMRKQTLVDVEEIIKESKSSYYTAGQLKKYYLEEIKKLEEQNKQ